MEIKLSKKVLVQATSSRGYHSKTLRLTVRVASRKEVEVQNRMTKYL
jgi:hypothetical protein